MAEMNDDLFGNLDSKMDFLNEQTKTNTKSKDVEVF